MLYRPRWKGRLFGFETTFDMKQYILWLSGQLNVLTLWGILCTRCREIKKKRIFTCTATLPTRTSNTTMMR